MMSDQTTFLSAITGRSIILALRAALSPSVLYRTMRCGLLADMILQKKPTRFAKDNPKNILVSEYRKSSIITAVKKTFPKITNRKYHKTVLNNTEPDNPNTADITKGNSNIPKRNSTTFPKLSLF
jgi:hypothetical protein